MSKCLHVGLGLVLLLTACSGDDTKPTPPDTTPPAPINDLRVASNVSDRVTLTWTAPGDDGSEGHASRYDVRYSPTLLAAAAWDSAFVFSNPPEPKRAGQSEVVVVSGLAAGVWYFRVRSEDDASNQSHLSEPTAAVVTGDLPPRRVTDLTAEAETTRSITLRWTAPGGDGGHGAASSYDLRYSRSEITESTWEDATEVQGLPTPRGAGSSETFVVTDLDRGESYFFGLKSVDDRQTESELSNIVGGSTRSSDRLTRSNRPFGAGLPDWSPTGNDIVFVWDREQSIAFQLYRIPASGGSPVQLTSLPGIVQAPAWSPDGDRIAFVWLRTSGQESVWELAVIDAVPNSKPVVVASHGSQGVRGAAWSPDGTRLAYSLVTSAPPAYFGEIHAIPSEGGEAQLIMSGAGLILGPLSWSPDGSTIAFSADTAGNFDIWVVAASGGQAVQLTDDPAKDSQPEWSPDGSALAFASDRAGSRDIWEISADGLELNRLTFESTVEGSPSWSPDGRQICYHRIDGVADIWTLYRE